MLKKLPKWVKLLYGAGSAGFSLVDRVVMTWLLYFYVTETVEGTAALFPAALFGTIMFAGRVVDAVADPLVARFSDNYGGRMGRRIPFMAVGGLLYVLASIAIFYPPLDGSLLFRGTYLALVLGLYFILFTVYVCPYLALLPELARSNSDRVDLSTAKAVFSLLGVGAALIGSGILIGHYGFHGMILISGAVGLFFLYLPVLIKEKAYATARPATLGLYESITNTFRNRAFLIFLAGDSLFWFGFNIVTLSIPFYVTVLLGQGEEASSLFFGAAFGIAVLAFVPVNFLAKRWGLKIVMAACMLLFVIFLPLLYFLGQPLLGLSPLTYGLIVMGLAGLPLAGLFIIPDTITAAVSDLEEQISGQRREGMYFGTHGLVNKITLGLSTLVTGFLLQFFGQTVANPLGVQLTGPVGAFFILLGLLIFTRYPEKTVTAYQEEIAAREESK